MSDKIDIIDDTLEVGTPIHNGVTPDLVNDIKDINNASADRPNLVETDEYREGQDGLATAQDVSKYLNDVEEKVNSVTPDSNLVSERLDELTLEQKEGSTSFVLRRMNQYGETAEIGDASEVQGLSAGDVTGTGESPLAVRAAKTGEKFIGGILYDNPRQAMESRNHLFDSLREYNVAHTFELLSGEDQALMTARHLWEVGPIKDYHSEPHYRFASNGGFEGGNEVMLPAFMSKLNFSTSFNESGFNNDNYSSNKGSNVHKLNDPNEKNIDVGVNQENIDKHTKKGLDKNRIGPLIDNNYSIGLALSFETYKDNFRSITKAVKHMPASISGEFKKQYTPQMLAMIAAGGFNSGRDGATKIWKGSKKTGWKVDGDYFKALLGDPSAKPIVTSKDPANIALSVMRQAVTALDFQGHHVMGWEGIKDFPNSLTARVLNMKINNRGETMTGLDYIKKYKPNILKSNKVRYSKKAINEREAKFYKNVVQFSGMEDVDTFKSDVRTPYYRKKE